MIKLKKIVSNVLIVSTQLIIGGLFLFMLFSDNSEDSRVVVVENNNLDKMADAVSELFVEEPVVPTLVENVEDKTKEEELITAEEKRAEEEAARKKAEEEAAEKARKEAEEAARKKAEEEEARKRAEAVISSNQTVASLQDYAHDLVINTYGWSEDDFVALVKLWNEESGWDVNCYNSYSGATGIPQALPGSKMASEGSDWATNGQTQIRWGLKYIQGRYGTPSSAWNHFLNKNWY